MVVHSRPIEPDGAEAGRLSAHNVALNTVTDHHSGGRSDSQRGECGCEYTRIGLTDTHVSGDNDGLEVGSQTGPMELLALLSRGAVGEDGEPIAALERLEQRRGVGESHVACSALVPERVGQFGGEGCS